MKAFKYKAALFDMDGVVTDTKSNVTSFWSDLASRWREPVAKEEFEYYVYGCQPEYTLDNLFPFLNEEVRSNVLKEMEESESKETYHAIQGIKQFILMLKNQGVKTALVTSGFPYKVEAVLRQLNLEHAFDRITTAKEIHRGKPDPQCYILTIEKLGVRPKDCIVFEDAISGVKAAVGSGAECIGINRNKEMLIKTGAKAVFDDFLDEKLLELLKLK